MGKVRSNHKLQKESYQYIYAHNKTYTKWFFISQVTATFSDLSHNCTPFITLHLLVYTKASLGFEHTNMRNMYMRGEFPPLSSYVVDLSVLASIMPLRVLWY